MYIYIHNNLSSSIFSYIFVNVYNVFEYITVSKVLFTISLHSLHSKPVVVLIPWVNRSKGKQWGKCKQCKERLMVERSRDTEPYSTIYNLHTTLILQRDTSIDTAFLDGLKKTYFI